MFLLCLKLKSFALVYKFRFAPTWQPSFSISQMENAQRRRIVSSRIRRFYAGYNGDEFDQYPPHFYTGFDSWKETEHIETTVDHYGSQVSTKATAYTLPALLAARAARQGDLPLFSDRETVQEARCLVPDCCPR